MANVRMSRINSEIQKCVAEIINNKLKNPDIDVSVSFTESRISGGVAEESPKSSFCVVFVLSQPTDKTSRHTASKTQIIFFIIITSLNLI